MAEMPTGILDMLILRTLSITSLHGYGIAQHIQRVSSEVLQVSEGSLYPALQRMQKNGWVTSKWKPSPTGRRARFYELTAAGRKQLGLEVDGYETIVDAITRVLRET